MSLRDLERESIREFLERNADLLMGRVLDYGCGRQPYRDVVNEAGGWYFGFDRAHFPGAVIDEDVDVIEGWDHPLLTGLRLDPWDAIICTQVLQYVPDWMRAGIPGVTYELPTSGPLDLLIEFQGALKPGGYLLMTGPTNWPVVELEDRKRFTVPDIDDMLGLAGFSEVETAYRAEVKFEGETWPLGWWAKARA